MKTIIAGSRNITDYNLLLKAIEAAPWNITSIISGGAIGVDKLAEKFAKENYISLQVIKADWTLGKKAGFIRNIQMFNIAEALIAIWDGKSTGTAHMIQLMKSKKKSHIFIYKSITN